jgi:hypothetical protein
MYLLHRNGQGQFQRESACCTSLGGISLLRTWAWRSWSLQCSSEPAGALPKCQPGWIHITHCQKNFLLQKEIPETRNNAPWFCLKPVRCMTGKSNHAGHIAPSHSALGQLLRQSRSKVSPPLAPISNWRFKKQAVVANGLEWFHKSSNQPRVFHAKT